MKLYWDIESAFRQGFTTLTVGSYEITVSLHMADGAREDHRWNAQMVDLSDDSTDGRNWFGLRWSTNIEDAIEEAESWLLEEIEYLKRSSKASNGALQNFLQWMDAVSPLSFDYLYTKIDNSPQCQRFKPYMDMIGAFRPAKQSEEAGK